MSQTAQGVCTTLLSPGRRDSVSAEISANSPVPSLCFIQALGSSATMKKMLYGMLTFFRQLWKYAGNERHLACVPLAALRRPAPSHFVPVSRLEKVTNFTFTVTDSGNLDTYAFDTAKFYLPCFVITSYT